ncbi:aspartate kinase [Streptomyces griseus]|uniref:aspartate kinase n=1 Tax=Streptomyces griseus TaxID=1911 RepID=UPI001C59EDA9|nr:aspartate kinase [Streptomyces griseus]MBW3706734.1 aspartate kinase [Streptomyces griseus]
MTTQGSRPTGDVVVQKYGGSSLATVSQVRQVADRVGAQARSGRRVVVVVSAQGDTTDELVGRAEAVNPRPAGHELDQLLATGETASAALMAMALQRGGLAATALSGARSGVLATGPHGAGVIVAVDTDQLRTLLDAGRTVVLAGFQGVTAEGDIITLGRGGSDTTAVAVAAELRSGHCEIYSDVPGVFTADPRVVPDARLMPDIDIDVMTEMAFAGARVMHARAVELAALYDVDILVGRSTATRTGTRIHRRDGNDMLEDRTAVSAVVHDADIARITLRTHDTPDPSADVFRFLAKESIPADMTTVSSAPDGGFSLGFTVRRSHAADVGRSFSDLMAPRPHGVEVEDQVAKVSIVGQGLLSRPEYASRMLASLVGSGISARSLTASQLRVSVTVPRSDAVRAVGLLHSEFGLGAEAGAVPASLTPRP